MGRQARICIVQAGEVPKRVLCCVESYKDIFFGPIRALRKAYVRKTAFRMTNWRNIEG